MFYWIAQGFGLISFGFFVWSFQKRQKTSLLKVSLIAQTASTIQYVLLGQFAIAATNTIAMARSVLVFEKEKHRWKTIVPLVFLVIAFLFTLAFSLTSWCSVFATLATLLYTLVVWFGNAQQIRIGAICCITVWMVCDIVIGSIFGACTDVGIMASAVVGLYRYRGINDRLSYKRKDRKTLSKKHSGNKN